MAVRLCEFESHPPYFYVGAIAQLVEQRTENPCVPGSIPGGTTNSGPVEYRLVRQIFILKSRVRLPAGLQKTL